MKDVIKGIFLGLAAVLLVGIISLFGGTILWLIWPIAIPAAFPGLVSSGVLAASIPWWPCVCLVWLFGILVKSSNSNTNKNSRWG